ncbi:MAG: class I SAM-dependent methyltransferase [Deltaproteobacteria bacterium]|nr:class I SAM-dependent methyltransferase [Deltaproteobacteria bacterium]
MVSDYSLADRRQTISSKPGLRSFYDSVYELYRHCIGRAPPTGLAIELGSGAGYAKRVIPDLITSDIVTDPEIDRVIDATQMDLPDGSARAFFLLNVFHHIPNVEKFLSEANRCLMPGGRILIVDHHPGWVGGPIYRWAHNEPFNALASTWSFPSDGPMTGANAALAWIVFERDRALFHKRFPSLRISEKRLISPLLYWLSGGMKSWTLLSKRLVPLAEKLDRHLLSLSENFGSFVSIELEKVGY